MILASSKSKAEFYKLNQIPGGYSNLTKLN